jgi:2-oxoisovalerate dehydrogenase E2 component (dihydrolipoyl transacylase)
MAVKEFVLPDLGEGLTESEIVEWHIKEGDRVELNQVIADVETAKALVELPSPHAGTVTHLFVEAGTTVAVGERIVSFEVAGAEPSQPPSPAPARAGDAPIGSAEVSPPNLVGYGAVTESRDAPSRRPRLGWGPPVEAAPRVEFEPRHESRPPLESESLFESETRLQPGAASPRRSTPPVRRLARRLGLDLQALQGTGEDGLVTRGDVEAAASMPTSMPTAMPTVETSGSGLAESGTLGAADVVAATDESGGADFTTVPVTGVHKVMAEAMVRSALTVPQATAFLTVDVTRTVELLAELRSTREFTNLRLTFLAALAKAVCSALVRHPDVNARWNDASADITEFRHVNLGIAAATPRGLMVPIITTAESLDLVGIAQALDELVTSARAGSTHPADLRGGTFTISNVGAFGVDAGAPIVNNGEAAILAVGAVSRRPWEWEGQLALRHVVTLSLSFDHRVLDGKQGCSFLSEVGLLLSNPARAFALA